VNEGTVAVAIIDATAGRRYFSDWIDKTLEALDQAAKRRSEA